MKLLNLDNNYWNFKIRNFILRNLRLSKEDPTIFRTLDPILKF